MNQRKSLLLVLLLSIVLISGVVLALGRTNHPEPLQNPVQSEPVQSPARQHEPVQNQAQTQQDPVLVGRVLHVEGQLLRYVPEEQQWVAVLPDTPWGKDETLYSAEKTRAEMVLPNNTRVRIGPSTEIRLVDLTSGRTEVDLIAGTARLLNKSSEVEIKVATAFGYAVITAGTILEVCADGTSAELIALQGNANFVHSQTGSHFEVMTGSNSLLVDEQQVGVGTGRIDTAWRQWNKTRDNLWAKRLEVKGDSVKYVHPSIRDESYVLDRYGSWSRVYYDGAYRYFWRPAHVAVGWAPFTVGSWMYWYGDWCWVPSEPFGYVTHHYGNWVLVSGCWYWAPPVAVTVGIGGPLLDIRFGWYPGRVAWVHSGAHIGWLPLAPGEIYYSHRYWGGPGSVVAGPGVRGVARLHEYRYARNAVIVKRADFARVTNYRKVMVRRANHAALLKTYKATRVANEQTLPGFAKMKRRQGFSAAGTKQKPTMADLQKARNKAKKAGPSALKPSRGKGSNVSRLVKGGSKSSLKTNKGSRAYGKDKGRKSFSSGGLAGKGGGKHSGHGKPVQVANSKSRGKWK